MTKSPDYLVDLACVVGMYIGETEKNLRRMFGAIRAAGAVLLFDEADALCGRRTGVKDAHDRYANLGTSADADATPAQDAASDRPMP